MAETFTRWDINEHLCTKEDARLYLEACAEEDPGDGSLIRAALNDIAHAQNMSQLARNDWHDPRRETRSGSTRCCLRTATRLSPRS